MRTSRRGRVAWWGFAALVLAFVYVPLGVIGINSFNADKTFGWPPSGFTTQWWSMAFQAQGPRDALLTWEPRVLITAADVTRRDGELTLTLTYLVVTESRAERMVIPLA